MGRLNEPFDRRGFFGLLAVGLAGVLAGCGSEASPNAGPPPPDSSTAPTPASSSRSTILRDAPTTGRRICLTVDDGYRDDVVAGYVAFAVRTGIHLTFSPNGLYGHAWNPHATQLGPLLERGQVQIINHTFNHPDLRGLSDAMIGQELQKNEEWINRTFHTQARPYYRPPFGFRNAHVDGVVADLGFTRTVLWNGSLGDSRVVTPQFLMAAARQYLQPGVIMLGHANHPTVLGLFDQLESLIRDRGLTPVTLVEMFGADGSAPVRTATSG